MSSSEVVRALVAGGLAGAMLGIQIVYWRALHRMFREQPAEGGGRR